MVSEQLPIRISYSRKVVGLDFCLSFFLTKLMKESLSANPAVTNVWFQLFSTGFNAKIDKTRSQFASSEMADVYVRLHVTTIPDQHVDLHVVTEYVEQPDGGRSLMWRPLEGAVTISTKPHEYSWRFEIHYPRPQSLDYEIRMMT